MEWLQSNQVPSPLPLTPYTCADTNLFDQLLVARRALILPASVSKLHWHPFGVYSIPLAKRHEPNGSWSRRLHIWHPDANPVGPNSIYGVHTHSGRAQSHVLAGSILHHIYEFESGGGDWLRRAPGVEQFESLVREQNHPTCAGEVHGFPADVSHGVSKLGNQLSFSLFEQLDGVPNQPFTTWQNQIGDAEELQSNGPVSIAQIQSEALALVESELFKQQTENASK